MTIELVDGKAGTMHISSEDKGIIHQAKYGKGDRVFDWGDHLKCTMKSANEAIIGTGCASIQGLDWHITNPETVTIMTGSQGMNRNDIVAAHYHRDNEKNGIETVDLKVLQGTPTSGTANDPSIPGGVILNAAVDAYQPLWRIPLTGITVGAPVCLFDVSPGLWDSVTRTELLTATFRLQDTSSFKPMSNGGSNTITVRDDIIFGDLQGFQSTVKVGTFTVWMPVSGVRPSRNINLGCIGGKDGLNYGVGGTWQQNGTIVMAGGISSGEILHTQRFAIPVPDGVTFSS